MPTDSQEGGEVSGSSRTQATDVANPAQAAKTPKGRDPALSARDELLARLDRQIEEQRGADDETFFQQGDPRAIALAAEMGRESRGEKISTDRDPATGRFAAAAGEEAQRYSAQEIEQLAAADAEASEADQAVDPLAEFIIREPGKPAMFKALVDGKVRLVPLDQARAQLQRHVAADVRLSQAAERQKQLDVREANIRRTEQSLQQRATPPQPAFDDAALEAESIELVRSLVSDPESVAAKKLSGVLSKIRAATPQIDINALGKQAASIAKQEIAVEDNQRALVSGFSKFTADYSDIAADPDLYAIADRKTDAIAAEHPEWAPEQVMLEAGKQTRDFVARLSGKTPAAAKTVDLASTRQQRKEGLKPMPQARSATPAAGVDANADQSAQSAVLEIRKARGQPY